MSYDAVRQLKRLFSEVNFAQGNDSDIFSSISLLLPQLNDVDILDVIRYSFSDKVALPNSVLRHLITLFLRVVSQRSLKCSSNIFVLCDLDYDDWVCILSALSNEEVVSIASIFNCRQVEVPSFSSAVNEAIEMRSLVDWLEAYDRESFRATFKSILSPYPFPSVEMIWEELRVRTRVDESLAVEDPYFFYGTLIKEAAADHFLKCLKTLKQGSSRIVLIDNCDIPRSDFRPDEVKVSEFKVNTSGACEVPFVGAFKDKRKRNELDISPTTTIIVLFNKLLNKPVGFALPSSTCIEALDNTGKHLNKGLPYTTSECFKLFNQMNNEREILLSLSIPNHNYLLDFMDIRPENRQLKILLGHGYYGFDRTIESACQKLEQLWDLGKTDEKALKILFGDRIGVPLPRDPYKIYPPPNPVPPEIVKYTLRPGKVLASCRNIPQILTLDPSQKATLEGILSNDLCLVQGPPGSAKTTIAAEAIVHLLKQGRKVVGCCYKQHAVDNLVDAVASMAPISYLPLWRPDRRGSIEDPRDVRHWITESSFLRGGLPSHYTTRIVGECKKAEKLLLKYVQPLSQSWKGIESHEESTIDGFQEVTNVKNLYSEFLRIWLSYEKPSKDQLKLIEKYVDDPLWEVPYVDRLRYLNETLKDAVNSRRILNSIFERITDLKFEGNSIIPKINAQSKEDKGKKNIAFVAGTTQWVAKNINMLAACGYDTIVIEEAAELCEVHSVACIPKTATKIVLVGDHMQLRPSVQNYELTEEGKKGHRLDISLFERLFCFHQDRQRSAIRQWCFTLQRQFRMPPSLRVFCNTLGYTKLKSGRKETEFPFAPAFGNRDLQCSMKCNSESFLDLVSADGGGLDISDYVRGQDISAARMSFFHHQFPEDPIGIDIDSPLGSRCNIGEAALVVARTLMMLKEGVSISQITILTPYLGQVRVLRRLLSACGLSPELEEFTRRDMEKEGLDDSDLLNKELERKLKVKALREAVKMEVERPPVLYSNNDLWESPGGVHAFELAFGLHHIDPTFEDLSKPDRMQKSRSAARIRLSTVDNYQGEENNHILVSFVRSNDTNKTSTRSGIGFLKNPNRLIVAFSRQQHSLTVFGNARCLRESPTWVKILELFENANAVYTQFPRICPRHLDCPESPLDFRHMMRPISVDTSKYLLLAKKNNTKQSKMEKVVVVELPTCTATCERKSVSRTCGHSCNSPCHEGDCPPCDYPVPVPINLLRCKHHPVTIPCRRRKDLLDIVAYRSFINSQAKKEKKAKKSIGPRKVILCREIIRVKCQKCHEEDLRECDDGENVATTLECGNCRKKKQKEEKKKGDTFHDDSSVVEKSSWHEAENRRVENKSVVESRSRDPALLSDWFGSLNLVESDLRSRTS